MFVQVIKPFVGHGFNMPEPGAVLDVSEDVAEALVGVGVAQRYETKIMPLPDVKKKAKLSESSPAGRAPKRKTRKLLKKSAAKSSR